MLLNVGHHRNIQFCIFMTFQFSLSSAIMKRKHAVFNDSQTDTDLTKLKCIAFRLMFRDKLPVLGAW